MQFYGWEFALRPGVLIIAALIAVSVWFGARSRVDDGGAEARRADIDALPSAGSAGLRVRAPQILFALFALGVFVLAFVDAMGHSFLARVFPAVMSVAGALAVLLLLWQLWRASNRSAVSQDTEVLGEYAADPEAGGLWTGMAWIALLVVLTALVGFFAAMVLFFVVFLSVRARTSALKTLLLTAAAAAFVLILANALALRFPEGLLQSYVRLPWPFGR